MNVIKLILRPCEEKYLTTTNNPTIISNDVPSKSPHLSQHRLSIPKLNHFNNEFQIDYLPSLILSSRSKTSTINAQANNTMTSVDTVIKVIDLKIYIAHVMNIRPDMLALYIQCPNPNIANNNGSNFQMLYDKDNFFVYTNLNGNTTDVRSTTSPNLGGFRLSSSRSFDFKTSATILYFKISNDKQKIMIDIFQNKVDKIILDVSPYCSIYMLKCLINQKLSMNLNSNFKPTNGALNLKMQNIYGAGFVENSTYLTKAFSNKKFNDNALVENIVNYYLKNNKKQLCTYNNDKRILNLILIENTNKKCFMGLDFRFNYMRNFKRVDNFDESAPSFREVSDGINLFLYCFNPSCSLNNEYFTIIKGYGVFDIFSEIYQIRCPKCKSNKKELRSIGMINSKWTYKGLLKGKRESKFEGDGFTMENNKLFALPEIQFLKQFCGLLIEVNYYKNNSSNQNENVNEYNMILEGNNDNDYLDEDDSDLDGIDLYYNREEEIPKKEKKVCTNKKNSIEEFWIYGNSNNHFVNNDNYFIHTKVYSNIINNDNTDNNNINREGDDSCEIKVEGKTSTCCVGCGMNKPFKEIECIIF